MAPLALPGIVLAFGYLACFSDSFLNPMVNPAPLLIISYIVRRLPYMVRSAVAGFQHVSRSLEEASTNLGARPFVTLRRITIPLVLSSLAAGAILTFVFSMFEVSQSLVLAQDQAYYPFSRVLYKLLGRQEDGPFLASAMGVVGMVVMTAGLLAAGRFLGRRLGEIFRT
jgi:iron(III) transport system permease protein